jgi:hypothetical protein
MEGFLMTDSNKPFTAEVVMMTPEWAERILEKNNNNRKVRRGYVDFLVSEMKSGNFIENGIPIIIDDNDDLLDAQHRLKAIVISGKSYWMVLVTGVPRDAMATVDVGMKRTLFDSLTLMTVNAKAKSSLVRMILFYDRVLETGFNVSDPLKKQVSLMQLLSKYAEYKDVVDTVVGDLVSNFKYDLRVRLVVVLFSGFIIRQDSVSKGTLFLKKVLSGVDLSEGSVGLELRRKITEVILLRVKPSYLYIKLSDLIIRSYYKDQYFLDDELVILDLSCNSISDLVANHKRVKAAANRVKRQ